MGQSIFELVGKIAIDGLENVTKSLNSIDKQVNTALKPITSLGKSFETLGKKMTMITAPITAAAAGILALSVKAGESASGLLKMQKQTDLSTDTLQEMKHVCKETNVDFDSFIGMIPKLTARMKGVTSEGGNVTGALEKLGFTNIELHTKFKNMNDLFPEIIKRLQGIHDTTQRNMLAQEIFGKKVSELTPILAMSSDQFAKMRQEAHDLGLVMSNESLQSADAFRQQYSKVKEQVGMVGQSIAGLFIPLLQKLFPIITQNIVPAIQGFVEKLKGLVDWFSNLSPAVQKTIVMILGIAAALGPTLIIAGKAIGIIKLLSSTVILAARTFLSLSTVLLTNPFGQVALAIGILITAGILLYKNWDSISIFLRKSWENIKFFVGDAISVLKIAFLDYIENWVNGVNIIGQYIPGLNKALGAAKKFLDDSRTSEEKSMQQRKKSRDAAMAALDAEAKLNTEKKNATKTTQDNTSAVNQNTKTTIQWTDEQIAASRAVKDQLLQQQLETTKNLAAQTKIRIQLNEDERKKAVQDAIKKGIGTADVNTLYDNKKTEIEREAGIQQQKNDLAIRQALLDGQAEYASTSIDNLTDYYSKKSSLLDQQKNIEIEDARDSTDAIAEINAKYSNQQADLERERVSRIDNILRQEYDIRKEWADRANENNAAYQQQELDDEEEAAKERAREQVNDETDLQETLANIDKVYAEKRKKTLLDKIRDVIEAISQVGNQISSIFSEVYNGQSQGVENWYKTETDAINNSHKNAKQKKADQEKLDAEYDKKKRALARKQAIADKATAIFNAGISMAEAIVKAFTAGPIIGQILAGITAALCAIQIAAIASRPLPLAEGAFILNRPGGVQTIVGEGKEPEGVFPMRTGAKAMADAIMGNLANMRMNNSYQQSAFSGQQTVTGGSPAGSTSNRQIVLQVGTLIADEGGLKQLHKRLEPYRIQLQLRRGQG